MSIQGIHHVTLIVNDEKKAAWFYGEVLKLEAKPRYEFNFPGLFYRCGSQELHLIIAARPLRQDDDLYIQLKGGPEQTFNFVHRHAALQFSDFDELKERLEKNGVKIVFAEEKASDSFTRNLVQGWRTMYGRAPIFCQDPFGNLLELIPCHNGSSQTSPSA